MTTLLQSFGIDSTSQEHLSHETTCYPAGVKGRLALIDADFIAYHVAHLFPTAEDTFSIEQKAEDIKQHYRKAVGAESVVTTTTIGDCKSYKYITAKQKPYQANRRTEKHPTVGIVKKYLSAGSAFDDWEADDQIGVLAHRSRSLHRDYVIISPDKDLRMVPGKHYDFKSGCIEYTEPFGGLTMHDGKLYGKGSIWFWAQMLMGDAVDNIQGLPLYYKPNGKLSKVGPVAAFNLLKDCTSDQEAGDIVARLYKEVDGVFKDFRTGEDISWVRAFWSEAALLWVRREFKQWDVMDFIGELYDGRNKNEAYRCDSCEESDVEKTERHLSALLTINTW